MNNYLGIDIGTTSICATLYDIDLEKIIYSINRKNNSNIESNLHFEFIQDAKIIENTVLEILDEVKELNIPLNGIGFTGQMHGILYTDNKYNLLSPLFTWQDKRGNEIYIRKQTYSEYLSKLLNLDISSGYGLVTHFYNIINSLVPKDSKYIFTISDYLTNKLANLDIPIIHSSNAHGIGIYDIETSCFNSSIKKIITESNIIIPKIVSDYRIIGYYNKLPVSVAIGDNQASFIGSIKKIDSQVLVNIGTGSQVSYALPKTKLKNKKNFRPLDEKNNLFVGVSLCGGKSYALLERFLSLYTGKNEYDSMNKLAKHNLKKFLNLNNKPIFLPYFNGTKNNQNQKASIEELDMKNFTPENVILSLQFGMIKELYYYYKSSVFDFSKHKEVICSGNGIRKSFTMTDIITNVFKLPSYLALYEEEASVGAAIVAYKSVLKS